MRPRQICMTACLLAGAAFGQSREDVLRSELKNVRYAPLAASARIEGDVRLEVSSGVIRIVSGHPLLARMAVESATAFGWTESQRKLEATYHFILVDPKNVPTSTTVKRGNAFERAILRVFGISTTKVVRGYRCEPGVAPANDVKVDGDDIEIWIYGRAPCLQVESATLVASR